MKIYVRTLFACASSIHTCDSMTENNTVAEFLHKVAQEILPDGGRLGGGGKSGAGSDVNSCSTGSCPMPSIRGGGAHTHTQDGGGAIDRMYARYKGRELDKHATLKSVGVSDGVTVFVGIHLDDSAHA
eukprot:GDKI01033664.1.p1 GENE.GDKI01033664.1~~GDKI01033664.1.p1  ORF type:complete len:136 (-),score=48.48 GDKI01033664.1:91-474(-)